MPHKRRISHDIVEFPLGNHALPIQPEGVSFHDVGVGFQGQEIKAHVYHILGFLHHLAFGNPQGGLGHGHGEVVNLDAVELADTNLDGIVTL